MYNRTKSRTCALEIQSMPDSVIVLIIIFFTLYMSKSHQYKIKWKHKQEEMEGEYTGIRYDVINIYVCACVCYVLLHTKCICLPIMGQSSSQVHKPPHRQKVIALYFSRANSLIILKSRGNLSPSKLMTLR